MSAKGKLRSYFEEHVGEILETGTLRTVAGTSEYARRIRELRDQEGMQIRTHRDRLDLKPGQYVLESLDRLPAFSRGISPALRLEILERNGFTCQCCGIGPGDPDPSALGRKARLQIDHVKPLTQGGTNASENLRVLCTSCNQARSNVQSASETAVNLLARIGRAPRAVQCEVYQKLKQRFDPK